MRQTDRSKGEKGGIVIQAETESESRSVAACLYSWTQAEEAQAPLSHSIRP